MLLFVGHKANFAPFFSLQSASSMIESIGTCPNPYLVPGTTTTYLKHDAICPSYWKRY
jgi:hypothetical protein